VRPFCTMPLLLAISSSTAQAQTAGEMLRSCEILQRNAHTEGSSVFLPPDVDARQCWGFMAAVQQFTTLADQNGKPLLNSRAPEDTKQSDIVRIFVDYARAHPDKMNLIAAAVAYNAMADAFPCK
jgi:hypothetical protein